jgi:hypothetical protein
MGNEILGRALGHCLSTLDGLSAAYLPDAVSMSTAIALVTSANLARPSGPSGPAFAILVGVGDEDLSRPDCLRLSPQSAIRYRQDDRLAIVVGRHPDLASFVQAFREVVGQAYPSGAHGAAGLAEVAAASLQLVLELSGVTPDDGWDRTESLHRLTNCLIQLRLVHEELRQGSRGWNAYWFEHVTAGFDHMVDQLAKFAANGSTLSLDDFFDAYTFASFSLPRPKNGLELRRPGGNMGKAIAEALSSWWSDSQTISITVKQLAHHPDTGTLSQHPLSNIDWTGYDRTLAGADNQLVALQLHVASNPNAIEYFAALSEGQFFDPLRRAQQEIRQLAVFGPDGADFSAGMTPDFGPFVLRTFGVSTTELVSERVRIRIPTTSTPREEDLASSALALVSSSPNVRWFGELELSDGVLWSEGEFARSVSSMEYSRPLLPFSLQVKLAAEDSLADTVDPSSSCGVYLLPHEGPGLAFMRSNSRGVLGRANYVGPERVEIGGDSIGEPYASTFDDSNSNYQVIIWGTADEDGVRLENAPVRRLKGRDGLWAIALRPHGLDEFSCGATRFQLRTPESKTACHSPIVAAIDNQQVSGDRPDLQTEQSVRGVLERLLADNIATEGWERALGHMVLPADLDIPLDGAVDPGGTVLLMSEEMRAHWSAVTSFRVDDQLANSPAAEGFRRAFADLGIPQALDPGVDGDARSAEWPSRTSWRHLWDHDRSALDIYLSAYAELVRVARDFGDPSGIFWATYPYSASIWDAKTSGKCVAVMLSPLHPIRLAWLASVESTLWEAPDAELLAGTLEGWNFPIVGPRETLNGRFVAIPTDSGGGQVFLGWSMLVEASIDGESPLTAPVRIGNLSAPGSAASGLNATAAAGALRSYRRMHPHISTLTVDLAASTATARLDEVDEAVLAAVDEWTTSKESRLRGGARVWDSLNRGGESPREAVTRLARSTHGAPLTWARYAPETRLSKRCNIRMLQDSGVRIEVGVSDKPNLGVIGNVPLRRFEAHEPPLGASTSSESRPALNGGGWSSFVNALAAVENADSHPRIRSKLFNSALVDDRADWTVSGEALMSPSAMASLVKGSGVGAQMLWEWRPPFLEASDGVPVLERRPFVSIARVPGSFREQLKIMLSKARGAEATSDSVSGLLGTLGARGVGLSSLISMGGTHAAGALGFYLAFSLMEQIASADCEQFVLPIDACDTFIKALAGESTHGEATRRADLLIIRLDDAGVTLTPIEIKFYGFVGAEAESRLAKAQDLAFSEPLDQLNSTVKLLQKLQRRWSYLRAMGNPGSLALWLNGLTSLVEAGARLRPRETKSPTELAERMGALVAGDLPVRIGRPIVTYFRHLATGEDGESFRAEVGQESSRHSDLGEFGALAANVSAAFEQSEVASSPLVEAWGRIVTWASQNATEGTEYETEFARQSDPGSGGIGGDPVDEFDEVKSESFSGAPPVDGSLPAEKGDAIVRVSAAQHDSGGSDQRSAIDDQQDRTETPPPNEPLRVEEGRGVKFPVGRLLNSVSKAEAVFWPSNTALNQMNVGVVGDLGTGKTQLLKSLIFNLRMGASESQVNPLSILIFDYKRDFQDEAFLSAVGGVVLKPEGIPLNIFALPDGYSALAAFQKAKAFCDVIGKIYAGVGPIQKDRLVNVITQLFKDQGGKPPTLAQVSEAYRDGAKADSVTGILNTFVLGEVFSDNPDDLQSFENLMQNKVLVLAVSDLGADQDSKNALVALFLNMYYEYMLKAQKWPYFGSAPQLRRLNSFLLVDEAVNIMRYEFPALMDVMLQGREFGFGTILASQYLSHFRTSGVNYGEPLLTWFIHKVPNVTPKELSQLGIGGLPPTAASRIAAQQVHEALYSSLGFQGAFIRGIPFYELRPASPLV